MDLQLNDITRRAIPCATKLFRFGEMLKARNILRTGQLQSFFSFLSEDDKDLHYLIISQPTTRCLLGRQVRYKTNSYVLMRRAVCCPAQGRTGHLTYRAYARWAAQYWGCLRPFGALEMHQDVLKCLGALCDSPERRFLRRFGASLSHNVRCV